MKKNSSGKAASKSAPNSAEPDPRREAQKERRRLAAAKRLAEGVHPDTLLNLEPEVAALTGWSKATIYRRARDKADPTFPRLIRLSSRCTRIRAGDLMAWLKAQGGA